MTVKFSRGELPMAYVMVETAERIKPRRDGCHPMDKFFLEWTAFQQVYVAIATQQGISPQLVTGPDGEVLTKPNGRARIPQVIPVGEDEQLALARAEFDEPLMQALIAHPSAAFFAGRTPFWDGRKLAEDALGQSLNGVVDVRNTSRADYPVWAPLDREAYQRCVAGEGTEEDRALLVRQITELLYTVSRNLTHISKTFDDGQDIAVYDHALPLIEMIVAAFIG